MDELRHRIFKILGEDPQISQRDLAKKLGISLGKTNYCIQSLLQKGWIKANNFKNSKNKLSYVYLLTPSGIEEKGRITLEYLKARMNEYEMLKREIEELKQTVGEDLNFAVGSAPE